MNPNFDPKYDLDDEDLWPKEQSEEKVPTASAGPEAQEPKPKPRGVRAKKKLAQALAAAWNECKEKGHPNRGYTAVPDFLLQAVAKSGCNKKDIPSYALMLSREIRWLWMNEGQVNKWAQGRFATIQRVAVENLTTFHVAKGYVQWRNAQPWCEQWRPINRAFHWRPNESFIEFLESGKRKPEQEQATPRKKGRTA